MIGCNNNRIHYRTRVIYITDLLNGDIVNFHKYLDGTMK